MKLETINITSVDRLFSLFDPADLSWDEWVFRGQPDSKYTLIPSIWRDDYKELFIKFKQKIKESEISEKMKESSARKNYELNSQEINNTIDCYLYSRFENYILYKFYTISNLTGLNVDSHALRFVSTYDEDYWLGSQMSAYDFNNLIERFIEYKKGVTKDRRLFSPVIYSSSLPQHQGVPTRLLDWTTNPRKAIFFALYFYLKNKSSDNKSKKISIYALKENKSFSKSSENPLLFQRIHARRENFFLHCQDGIFSSINGEYTYIKSGKWPSIEDLYVETQGKYFSIKKYHLSIKDPYEILKRLEKCGISMSTLMPDYFHVAEQVTFQVKHCL